MRGQAAELLDRGLYIAQRVVILLIPAAIALVCYAILIRLLAVSGRPVLVSWLTPSRLSSLFIGVDVITFLLKVRAWQCVPLLLLLP